MRTSLFFSIKCFHKHAFSLVIVIIIIAIIIVIIIKIIIMIGNNRK